METTGKKFVSEMTFFFFFFFGDDSFVLSIYFFPTAHSGRLVQSQEFGQSSLTIDQMGLQPERLGEDGIISIWQVVVSFCYQTAWGRSDNAAGVLPKKNKTKTQKTWAWWVALCNQLSCVLLFLLVAKMVAKKKCFQSVCRLSQLWIWKWLSGWMVFQGQ